MATVYFTGNAAKVAQVQSYTFGGTWEADDVVKVAFGTKIYYFTGGSATITTAIDNIVTAWNALDSTVYPEFAEITASRSSSKLVLTADTAGMPFTCTITPLEANYGAADSQTIEGGTSATTGTATTASAGPNDWSSAANWSGGAVPSSSDTVYIENTSTDILYGFAQSAVTLTKLVIAASYTGKIGLPPVRSASSGVSYYEYRSTYLAISATTLQIGQGIGQRSGRIKIDLGSNASAVTIFGTGSPYDSGYSAVLLKGTHNSNTLDIYGGYVGVCELNGETAKFPIVRVNAPVNNQAATVRCGAGLDSATVLTQNGGTVEVNSAMTTIYLRGGKLTVYGTGATANAYVYGGELVWNTTGELGSSADVEVYAGGVVDFDQDARTKSCSNAYAFRGATIKARNGSWAVPTITLYGCSPDEVNLSLPIAAGRVITYT